MARCCRRFAHSRAHHAILPEIIDRLRDFEPLAMLVFGKTEPKEGGGICREEEAIFCRADSGVDETGRGWGSGGGADPEGRDQRADLLTPNVRRLENLSCARAARDWTRLAPDVVSPTSGLHLPDSDTSPSKIAPALPKQASSICAVDSITTSSTCC